MGELPLGEREAAPGLPMEFERARLPSSKGLLPAEEPGVPWPLVTERMRGVCAGEGP